MKIRAPAWFAVFWGLFAAGRAWSEPQAARPDPFAAIQSVDPMEMAHLVDRLGDNAVLERLSPDRPVEVRLAALRAAPWMRAPENALPAAALVLGGRDSELAPAAARSAARIASALDADKLETREAPLRELSAAREKLVSAGNNLLLRGDIRLYALQAAEAIKAAGVP